MNRILKIGFKILAVFVVLLTLVYIIFINSFKILGEPEKNILNTNCDYEGLRQATTYNYGGNASTIPLILVSIDMGCYDYSNDNYKRIIFSAEHKSGTEVKTKWIDFNTLEIKYSEQLKPVIKIYHETFDDPTLNVNIEYKTE